MQKKLRNIEENSQAEIQESVKKIFLNQATFERNYLKNTTNETNVNMYMYKVYKYMYEDDFIYTFRNC